MTYNRDKAVEYAKKWAFNRNPNYLNFDKMGGDCTNFVSQCLRAGGAASHYKKTFGWYYNSATDRAPAWTGVPYFYKFLTGNTGVGPFAKHVRLQELEPGDVVQLALGQEMFGHSLLVVEAGGTPSSLLLSTHSRDCFGVPLDSYDAIKNWRFLKIFISK